MSLTFDIFCKVVDNYGDIGVCWRLARRLAGHEGSASVRLWVDDLVSFARIASHIDPNAARQQVQGVTVLHWRDDESIEAGDVVIEAFACELPASFVARMSPQQIWINLEYLSAEDWVESCHALPSPQAGGLRKFFFFPGFTPATGGLLREPALIERRERWQADASSRQGLLTQLGVSEDWRRKLDAGALLIYVYCYPQAPLAALFEGLQRARRDALVIMPQGIWPGELPPTALAGDAAAAAASNAHPREATVALHPLPFVDQDVFDCLLWSSDLNVVRGEDSLLRAIWAGRPMIWQPYLQEDDTHLQKLEAWLAHTPFGAPVHELMRAWNTGGAQDFQEQLPQTLEPAHFLAWGKAAVGYSAKLAQDDDLATRLLRFCAELRQTR